MTSYLVFLFFPIIKDNAHFLLCMMLDECLNLLESGFQLFDSLPILQLYDIT